MLTRIKGVLELYGPIVVYVATMSFSAWLIVFAPDYPFPEDRFNWMESQ